MAVEQDTSLNRAIAIYMLDCEARQLTEATRAHYGARLRQFDVAQEAHKYDRLHAALAANMGMNVWEVTALRQMTRVGRFMQP